MKTTRRTDLELIRLAQKGDLNSKTELCRRYKPLIKKYASLTHVASMQKEMSAHLWLTLIESIQRYNIDSHIPVAAYFKSCIYYATWNLFKHERQYWQKEQPGDTLPFESQPSLYYHGKKPPNGEDIALRNEVKFAVKKALYHLSLEEKDLIHKHYNLSIPLSELARQKGVTKQAVSYMHRKIINKLRHILWQYLY